MQARHGVRGDQRLDVVLAGALLLGEQRRERRGVAGEDLLLASQQGGALADRAGERDELLERIRIAVSTTLSGRSIARTGRYRRFPIAGLALMTASLVLLAALAGDRSQVATGIGLTLFGLGFGMVTQILVVAVQNGVDRRELGVATATTSFFRALGGAAGAAVLGAVFAAQAGSRASSDDIVDAVQAVFLVAAPLAALALLVVLFLPESPLQSGAPANRK